jgi:hypothetical protein
MRVAGFVFAALLISSAFAVPAAADRRVALVIGNSAYQHADELTNPVIDARSVRAALARIGFDDTSIVYGENLGKRDFERAIARFAASARDSEVALVFYAGHGATFGGVPYAVPVDAQFTSLESMPYELVTLDAMVGELRRAKGIGIAIFDACRDNGAEQKLKRGTASRGGEASRGLAPPANTDGLIVAFSTGYNATAADGAPGANSPYTAALVQQLPTPGLDIVDLFRNVGRQVKERTGGRQNPALQIDGFYDHYALVAGPGGTPASGPAAGVTVQGNAGQPAQIQPAQIPPPRVPPGDQVVVLPPVTTPRVPPPAASAPRVQPSGFIFPDSHQRLLSSDEISRLSLEEARIARNEIFARRGRAFKSPELQAHFGRFSWYHPTASEPALNRIEEQNVARLQQQETLLGATTPYAQFPAPSPAAGRSNDFIFVDSDQRLLSSSEFAGLSAAELRIARNEIYARRGIYFKSADVRAYFERFSWYRPSTWEPPLNAIESRNVNLIKQAEVGR